MWNLVEMCAGLGASASGLVQAGFVHKCSMEWREPIAELHRRLHKHVPVIAGDIANVSLLKLVHQECQPPFTLAAGFSCQPFSQGGSQAGQFDDRSSTLPAIVKAAHLMQCPVLIGECVTPASCNAYVRAHLRVLESLGYCVSEAWFRLEDVWAAKRHRWWFVAVWSCLHAVPLKPMPGGSPLVFRDLIPFHKVWPSDDMQQLCLTSVELQAFQREDKLMKKHVVQVDAKLPTALHSWGCQCVACECGCRNEGLSDSRLLSRGIFAQVVPVGSEHGFSQFRHLHAVEVSLMNGFLPLQDWGPNQRLNLCAIGQLGSPLQALWVGACIRQHIALLSGQAGFLEPMDLLHQAKTALFAQSKVLYPSLSLQPSGGLSVDICVDGEPSVRCLVDADTTVADVLHAEGQLGRQHTWFAVSLPDRDVLQSDDKVAGLAICLVPHTSCPVMPSMNAEVSSWSLVPVPDQCEAAAESLCPSCVPASSAATIESLKPSSPEHMTVDDAQVEVSVVQALLQAEPEESIDALSSYAKLSQKALLALLPPLVPEANMSHALRQQLSSARVRLQLLPNQGDAWGDDEILWGLSEMQRQITVSGIVVLDPLLATSWLQTGDAETISQALSVFGEIRMMTTAIHVHEHWIPVVWTARSGVLEVAIWEHDSTDINILSSLHAKLTAAFGLTSYSVAYTRRTFGVSLCGAAVMAFGAYRMLGHELPSDEDALLRLHETHKTQFAGYLQTIAQIAQPWCWGLGVADTQQLVATMLQFHGVPSGQTQQRARLVIQSLGKEAVHSAITGVSPWKSLKALANQHKPPLQLVLQDEHAAVIAKQGPKSKSKKGNHEHKTMPTRPTEIDPSKLMLDAGMFRCGQDEPLSQLSLAQIGPLSSGVAIASFADAQPFLKSGRLLTSKALAILVINYQQELETTLTWSTLRFAARCTINQEPMLLNGVLVQLGTTHVYQFSGNAQPVCPPVEVACARVTVYADQWEGSWDDFCTRPVKMVLMKLPMLMTCRQPADTCTCKGWHPSSAQAPDAVLDVFRRQFYNDNNKPVKAEKASYFCVFLRYAKELEVQVLSNSGLGGIYIEPKTEDALQPHSAFQVVWLPQLTYETISHKARCEVNSLGLARSGPRYGIRVGAQHFQNAFAAFKPEAVFLAPGQRSTFQCGPWPYGLDRKSLARTLKEWGWAARPLQPMQSVQGGLMWAVQAVSDPPSNVLVMPHGQVVVSRQHGPDVPPSHATAVVGQSSTVQLCAVKDAKCAQDPWLKDDPWRMAVNTIAPPVPAPAHANALEEMEQRIEKSLLAKLPPAAEPMEVDDQENRLQQLEQQLTQLSHRQNTLETTVAENHMQSTAQVQSLQQQMMGQLDMQSKQLQNMLSDQMVKIENILAKKPRME